MKGGTVYLVGAGPGDPRLLTVRAVECIRGAEVLVYDRLASPRLLNMAPPAAELVYAGKSPRSHALSQREIGELLVERAREGRAVVRLKGGDPFVFGRGGEEAEHLAAAGVPFEVVPGVTAAVAVPAYAGIPLTHRDYSSSFAVITGHEAGGRATSRLDWSRLAGAADTLVFLMGVERLSAIVGGLQEAGCSPRRPAALIRWGTRSDQQVLTGTLGDIVGRARDAAFHPPAVLVVGEVVRLREKIAWAEKNPLFGRRVVVTRAPAQAAELSALIESYGGESWEFPAIDIIPPSSWEPLDCALDSIGDFRWVAFTSANGVKFFFRRLEERGMDVRALAGRRLAAIGPGTRRALRERGLLVEYMPEEYRAEAVAEGLLPLVGRGERVLLPRATAARPALPRVLEEGGVAVEEVPVYRTVRGPGDVSRLCELLSSGRVDAVTFTSSSTVCCFCQMLGSRAGELLQGVTVVSIGPVTSGTLRRCGLAPHVEARRYTLEGLVASLVDHYRSQRLC